MSEEESFVQRTRRERTPQIKQTQQNVVATGKASSEIALSRMDQAFADTHLDVDEVEQAASTGDVATIRLLLVDDHILVREGLRRLLELEEDIVVIAGAANGQEALQAACSLRPDVVLMDISMPTVDGIAVTRQIVEELPSVAVIMLTVFRQQQHILRAMRSGARGYLLKSATLEEVAQAIRKVHEGGTFISSELTGELVNEYRRLSDATSVSRPSIHALNETEIEIIRRVATGMNNREIAEQLSYSEKTVKNYLSIVFQKLGIRDRTQAAIFALRQGLIPLEEW
jgi:DNA-binding NarL/FixJ family response regulator